MKFWIARDEDGSLYLYDKEPILKKNLSGKSQWQINAIEDYQILKLDSFEYSQVTYENSPQIVTLNIENNG